MATCIGAVVNFSRVACGNWSRKGSEQCRACEREEWTNRGALPPVGCKWCQCGVAIASYKASCNPCKNKFKCSPCNASYADGTSQYQQSVRNGPYNVPADEALQDRRVVCRCNGCSSCSIGYMQPRSNSKKNWEAHKLGICAFCEIPCGMELVEDETTQQFRARLQSTMCCACGGCGGCADPTRWVATSKKCGGVRARKDKARFELNLCSDCTLPHQ